MQSRSSTELQRSRHGTPMLLSGLRPQHYKVTCRERPLVAQSCRSRACPFLAVPAQPVYATQALNLSLGGKLQGLRVLL
jgi:hypothetical protein